MKFNSSAVIVLCLTNILFGCFVWPLQIVNGQINKATRKTCLEPPTSGLCRDKLLRYAYDNNTNSCISFYYSGCAANHNNFLTYEECRRECIPQSRYKFQKSKKGKISAI